MAWIFTVPQLLARAKKAVDRSIDDGGEALVAIVFAAVAVEGYLNEAAQYVRTHLRNEPHEKHPEILAFSTIFPELEDSHAQLDLKLEVAGALLRGDIWSKGKQPLQDLMLLIRLRNAVLHPKPLSFPRADDELPKQPDRIIASLVRRGIIKSPPMLPPLPTPSPASDETYAPWFVAIQSAEVAKWALQTAAVGIVTFAQSFPDGTEIRKHLEYYLQHVYGLLWEKPGHGR
jgi:hypothetical protein